MRITIKPPSPTPPSIQPGALVGLRVETADPAPLLAGPPSITYEGRYAADPAPAFLFPAPGNGAPEVSTAAPSASDFRAPFAPVHNPYVDIPAHEGDTIAATLTLDGKTYSAALRAPAAPLGTTPVEMTLAEGPSTPPPTPQPAEGLTITPHQHDEDVWTLDTAPGADDLIVVN